MPGVVTLLAGAAAFCRPFRILAERETGGRDPMGTLMPKGNLGRGSDSVDDDGGETRSWSSRTASTKDSVLLPCNLEYSCTNLTAFPAVPHEKHLKMPLRPSIFSDGLVSSWKGHRQVARSPLPLVL